MFAKGAKQGNFDCKESENRDGEVKKLIACYYFDVEIRAPRDVATGQASGKRQHQGLTFHKRVDSTTDKFWTAISTNETLEMRFDFFRTNPKSGAMEKYYVIKLTDANVAGMKLMLPEVDDGATTDEVSRVYRPAFEQIKIFYRKIETEHVVAKSMFVDDWAKMA
jgi:type VI secretion system secreted protein Hcp